MKEKYLEFILEIRGLTLKQLNQGRGGGHIYSRLSRCSRARESNTGLSSVDPARVQAEIVETY